MAKSENYIARLQRELSEARAQVAAVREELIELEVYYSSAKFRGHENNYAYVSTDVLPRLGNVLRLTIAD